MQYKIQVVVILFSTVCAPTFSSANQDSLLRCEQMAQKAHELDAIRGVKSGSRGAVVTTGPTWHKIDFSAKEGIAETLSCVMTSGKLGVCAQGIEFIDHMNGKTLAVYENCRLKAR